jgi:hypothetical protein
MLARIGRAGVRAIDRQLRAHYRVMEYSASPDCLMRIAPGRSPHTMDLADGTHIERGAPVLNLHLWNEHLDAFALDAASLQWGVSFARAIRKSLRELAAFLSHHPEHAARALYGELGMLECSQLAQAQRLVARFGFELVAAEPPGYNFLRYAFWQNLFSWWLLWTYNPASMKGKHFARLCRCELWMSTARLFEWYGDGRD